MQKFIITGFLLALFACESPFDWQPTEKIFIIRTGEHEVVRSYYGFSEDTLSFTAEFNSSAKYQCENPDNQSDINKLLGFSNCNSFHQQNSARVGWRWYNGRLEVFTYVYDNGTRSHEYITKVPLNKAIDYQIIINENGYLFKVGGVEKQVFTSSSCSGTSNYLLWPYFGGDETAPHDIEIKIQL